MDNHTSNPLPKPMTRSNEQMTYLDEGKTLYSDPHTSPLKPALNLRSVAPTVFVSNDVRPDSFVKFCLDRIEEITKRYKEVVVSCLLRHYIVDDVWTVIIEPQTQRRNFHLDDVLSLKSHLITQARRRVNLSSDSVSFISDLEASGCQYSCVVMIMDQSVKNAHEVELIMSRATLYLYVVVITHPKWSQADLSITPSEKKTVQHIIEFFTSRALKAKSSVENDGSKLPNHARQNQT